VIRRFLTFLSLVLLIVGGWLVWALWMPVTPPGTKFVLLRPGWSSKHIASELQQQGVIRSGRAFLLMHYITVRSLKAGEYKFDQPATGREVLDRLVKGDIYAHTVVIPEGFNLYDVANAIQQAGLGTRDEFIQMAKDPTPIKDIDPEATTLEGYLFPDTYSFTRTQGMRDMITEMLKRFRQQAQQAGLTQDFHRVVTMASIVEKETAAADERPMVASVYYNRMAARMPLDADPSVIYAALVAGRYSGAIHQSDLAFDSPYNTYRYAGLPPGPIANPGKSALEAAMHPATSDYLYFVADGSGNGHHRFARTLDEHNHNVAMYRRAVQDR
jgi:UPF0755 protein